MYAKNTKSVTVEPLLFPTYMSFVQGSVDSKMFAHYYCRVNGQEQDVLRDGTLSCAVHLSSVLKLVSLIDDVQLTVHRALDAMMKAGWVPITEPRVGCVIVWNPKENDSANDGISASHVRHAGFYIGEDQAISNVSRKGVPGVHDAHYHPIEMMLWHPRLG